MTSADWPGRPWRRWLGLGALLVAIVLPVSAIFLALAGMAPTRSPLAAFLLVGGLPEIMCLAAIAVLGGDNFRTATRPLPRLAAPASRLRYYAGLMGCLLNGLPLFLYAYVPWLMPEGMNKYYILAAADLVFISSVFLAGGEFWEKFRRLFIWDGRVRE